MSLLDRPKPNPSNVSDLAKEILGKPTVHTYEWKIKKLVPVDEHDVKRSDKETLEQQELGFGVVELIPKKRHESF